EAARAVLLEQASDRPFEVTIAPASNGQLEDLLLPEHEGLMEARPEPSASVPQVERPSARAGLRLLRRVGIVDPTSLDSYRAHGGYEAIREALRLAPTGVIREVKDAKLLWRGGAAFP